MAHEAGLRVAEQRDMRDALELALQKRDILRVCLVFSDEEKEAGDDDNDEVEEEEKSDSERTNLNKFAFQKGCGRWAIARVLCETLFDELRASARPSKGTIPH